MTEHERQVIKNLIYALEWHCRDGIGPCGMDRQFIANAKDILSRDVEAKHFPTRSE